MRNLLVPLLLSWMLCWPANAVEFDFSAPEVELEQEKYKFELDEAAFEAAASAPLEIGDGYAQIGYRVGTEADKAYYRRAILALTNSLPKMFGNSAGTYTIALIISDAFGQKTLAKEPILTFQWNNRRAFFFIDKVVERLLKTNWSATPIDNVAITDSTKRFRVALEIFRNESRSMDLESLQETSKLFNEGALALLLPVSPVVTGYAGAVAGIIDLFYSGAISNTLVDTDEYAVKSTEQTYQVGIKFRDPQGTTWRLPIYLTIGSKPSRFMSGEFNCSRFGSATVDREIFPIVTGKDNQTVRVSLLELVASSEKYKSLKPFLVSLQAGENYTKGDLNAKCGNLYSAFQNALSYADAAGYFRSFATKYQSQLIGPADSDGFAQCLGPRKQELVRYGCDL